jgi:hypothetical protein
MTDGDYQKKIFELIKYLKNKQNNENIMFAYNYNNIRVYKKVNLKTKTIIIISENGDIFYPLKTLKNNKPIANIYNNSSYEKIKL